MSNLYYDDDEFDEIKARHNSFMKGLICENGKYYEQRMGEVTALSDDLVIELVDDIKSLINKLDAAYMDCWETAMGGIYRMSNNTNYGEGWYDDPKMSEFRAIDVENVNLEEKLRQSEWVLAHLLQQFPLSKGRQLKHEAMDEYWKEYFRDKEKFGGKDYL